MLSRALYGRRSQFTTLKWPVNHFSTHETRQTAFHLLPKTLRDLPARNATASEPLLLMFSASKYYFIPCTAAQPAQEPTETWRRDKGRAGGCGREPPSHKHRVCSPPALRSMCTTWPHLVSLKRRRVERSRCFHMRRDKLETNAKL